ncbi:MAG: hypothetical protein U0527_07900 [Candidatus Eisenbacteria bacterium]
MIVIRDELRIAPEGMKTAREAVAAMLKIESGRELGRVRVLTDLVGEYYTLVIETETESLSTYELWMQKLMPSDAWQKAYAGLRPLVRGGKRSVYTLLS